MSFFQENKWWKIGIGAALGYVVLYSYQYQRELPSKTKWDKNAERASASLTNIKKRSISSDYMNTSIQIRGVVLRNRIIKSATFESASLNGKVSETLIQFHVEQAYNAGMVTVSYGCISVEGRTFPHQLLLLPQNKAGLKQLTSTIHQQTAAAISIQLTHAGFMAEPFNDAYTQNKTTKILSASRVWSWAAFQFAKEMSVIDIKTKINEFGEAALLCKQCGFDAVTLHCGHGYLISQFLSLLTNHRNDEYGAQSMQSRSRFAADIVKKIRELCGDSFPIFVKINSHDGVDGGVTVAESIQFCQILIQNGADVVIPTAGFILANGIFMMRGSVPIYRMVMESVSWVKKIGIGLVGPWLIPKVKFRSMFLLQTSLELLNGLDLGKSKNEAIVCYLGGITSLDDINKAFESGFELVSIGRALLREPDFLDKIRQNPSHISLCDHENRCIIGQMSGKSLKCYARDHDCKNSKIDIEDLR